MKKRLTLFLLFFYGVNASAQIAPDAELAGKLQGKTKLRDIKQTVNNHFYAKLNAPGPADSDEKKRINRQLKKWNRKFWISENYTNADGEVVNAAELNYNAYQQLNNQRLNQPTNQSQPWALAGPYNSDDGMGRFDKLAFHPTDPNTIYAGSPHGGLFRTANAGADWFPVSEFLASLGISGIAIDPVNPNIMYVLTGDAHSMDGGFVDAYLYRSASLGVFKTFDGGINWLRTGLLAPVSPSYQGRDLIIDPNNPLTLIAATSVGIYRTNNGGLTWVLSNIPPSLSNNVWELRFKPGDPNIVYAAGNNFFIRSTDNGANFTAIMDATTNMNLAGSNRISIAVTPNNPNRVVLLAGRVLSNTTFTGFFTSGNSGQNFTLVTQTPNIFSNTIGNSVFADQSDYDNCIAISPVNENQIVAGGLCVWGSVNGGVTWTQASAYWPDDAPYMHPDIQAISFNPLNNNLYCVNDGGIYVFTGAGWAPLSNGATTTQFYHFERENDEGDVWGGAQDNGVLEQDGGGAYFIYQFGDGYDVMTDHEYLVANGEADDVYLSVNQFVRKDVSGSISDITPQGSQGFFANLAMSPDLEDKIYAGYSNATYISTNAGDSWTSLGNVSGNWCISTCPSNTNFIYVAGSGQISRFQAPGTWTNLTASLVSAGYNSSLKITDIDVHPANHDIIYISSAGTKADSKIFRTLNGGANWENLSFNLPNVPIFSVKRDNFDGLYAGTSIGVFYKRNGVNYWEPFSNNLPPVPVTEIELWAPDNQVWVSTFGRGLWVTPAYSNCAADLPLIGVVAGNQYIEVSGTITSSQTVQGGEGTFVKYNAGNQIKLVPGFKVSIGSRFKTFTTGCGGQVDPLKIISPDKK